MVGDLSWLPWKPCIDVIERTKFWYRLNKNNDNDNDNDNDRSSNHDEEGYGYQVHFYDEQWEVEAGLAFLQLITPKGKIPNSKMAVSEWVSEWVNDEL